MTFRNDKDACLALFVEKSEKHEMFTDILPAHTWKQPSGAPKNDETSLLLLNDHCLLKIFKYCDLHTQSNLWQVSQRTRKLVEAVVWPNVDAYTWHLVDGVSKIRLKRFREELQFIGPHVKKLRLEERYKIKTTANHDRYFHQVHKYCGESLKTLELHNLSADIFSDRNLMSVGKLFHSIEVLSLSLLHADDFAVPVDVQLPKLKELTIRVVGNELYYLPPHDITLFQKSMPNLERVTARSIYADKDVGILLKNNRQLKYLTISIEDTKQPIISIAEQSRNLNELVLYGFFFDEYDLYE